MEKLICLKTLLWFGLLMNYLMSPYSLSQSSVNGMESKSIIEKEFFSVVNFHEATDQVRVTGKLQYDSQENKFLDIKVNRVFGEVETNDKNTLVCLTEDKEKTEAKIMQGERTTETYTIQNSTNSPLIWNISPEGSEKLLYRVYIKDRILSELKKPDKEKSDDVITSAVFDAKETALKLLNNETNSTTSEVSIIKSNRKSQEMQNEVIDIVNSVNDIPSSMFSDNVEISQHKEFSGIEIPEGHLNLTVDNFSSHSFSFSDEVEFLPSNKIFENSVLGIDLRNQIQVFQQWYRFADCGYTEFDPQTEVWEVSSDNGVHWMQILEINGESYVLNAECFNPVYYIEHNSIKGEESPYSSLIAFDEFVKQVESGPVIFPKSGIIPANTSVNLKLEVDATTLEEGIYNPKLVLTDAASLETIEVIPLRFNVIPELEKEFSNQLAKQTIGQQFPDKYELFQNFPNPFNPSTTIKYDLPEAGIVTIKVYDVLGREVSSLVNEQMQAGRYEINFDASSLSSGTYFYRIQAGDFNATKKMLLLK